MNLDDEKFLLKVEEYTSNQIQRKDDIRKIIDAASTGGKENQFESLIFTAKYICGLMRVLKTAPETPKVNSIDHVNNDLNENMKNGIEQLKDIMSLSDESNQEYFNKTYFTLTPHNFTNLTQLFSDLELVKKYTNHIKRQS